MINLVIKSHNSSQNTYMQNLVKLSKIPILIKALFVGFKLTKLAKTTIPRNELFKQPVTTDIVKQKFDICCP